MLAAVISNMSGKMLKRMVSEKAFLIDYLGEMMATSVTKTIEQQRAEFRSFTSKYRAVVKEVKHVT